MNDIQINKTLVQKIIIFLDQYKEKLQASKYIPHQYRADTISDILEQLRNLCHD